MWLLHPHAAGQPLGVNAIIAMALDISQLYAGDPTLTNILPTPSTGCKEILEAGTTGLTVASTQTGHPAEPGNLTEASPSAPAIASAPVTALPKITEAKEDLLTMEEVARPNIGIRSVISNHLPPSQTGKGQLYTDRAPDGHRAFHTTLQLVTKQGCKPLPIKVDPDLMSTPSP